MPSGLGSADVPRAGVPIAGLLEHAKALAEARMAEIEAADPSLPRNWWEFREVAKRLSPLVHAAARAERLA